MPISRRVLVVEDDAPKLKAILQMLEDEYPHFDVLTAKSLSSAIEILSRGNFDLAIVDMSLPTYDLVHDSFGGGAPQGFGGEDILRFIASESEDLDMVVLTQYDEFPSEGRESVRSLNDVHASLSEEIGARFKGVIFYSGLHGDWKVSLCRVIDAVGANNEN
jgi:CheY-like chemotaxis protein